MRHAIRALASSFVVAVVAVVAAPANAIAGEPAASVRELSWIAGRWKAVMDKDVSVEETWTQPLAGSIASLVRITRANATDTIEMIVIAEEGGSLVLRIQQWSLDYKPRTDPQVMRLAELGKDSVVFEAANKGPIQKLGYRREGCKLIVSATTNHGPFVIPLNSETANGEKPCAS